VGRKVSGLVAGCGAVAVRIDPATGFGVSSRVGSASAAVALNAASAAVMTAMRLSMADSIQST
jgi:hypothetical protein